MTYTSRRIWLVKEIGYEHEKTIVAYDNGAEAIRHVRELDEKAKEEGPPCIDFLSHKVDMINLLEKVK